MISKQIPIIVYLAGSNYLPVLEIGYAFRGYAIVIVVLDVIWETKQSRDTAGVNNMLKQMIDYKTSKNKYHNHCVILFHDYYFDTPKSLDNLNYLIEILQNKYHCVFRWASEFPGV